jgi:hypothetical protein
MAEGRAARHDGGNAAMLSECDTRVGDTELGERRLEGDGGEG